MSSERHIGNCLDTVVERPRQRLQPRFGGFSGVLENIIYLLYSMFYFFVDTFAGFRLPKVS